MTRGTRSTRNTEYKVKFFPFSAGIPWKIERGKYIVPELDSESWHRAISDREVVITAFGGLFESFFSLSAAEAIAIASPGHQISWLGNSKFSYPAQAQGICDLSQVKMSPKLLDNYPVPIFFDQKDRAYFNVLNNYKYRQSYWGKFKREVKTPVTQQIFSNVMVPWNFYTPKMRRLGSDFYDSLLQSAVIKSRSRIVSIILTQTETDVLGWTLQQVKEFAQLAKTKGLKVLVFTDAIQRFYGSNVPAYEYDIRKILQVLPHSWMVLSSSIDWVLIAMMIGDGHLLSKHIQGCFDLLKNAEFLGAQNDIFTDREGISPIDAFTICEGLL